MHHCITTHFVGCKSTPKHQLANQVQRYKSLSHEEHKQTSRRMCEASHVICACMFVDQQYMYDIQDL